MAELSFVTETPQGPELVVPRDYNAAVDLIERNLSAGRGAKTAYIDDAGSYSFEELASRVNRAANTLRGLGLGMEDRIMVALYDGIDFPSVFLGAIKAGIVPIATNTLLTTKDYEFMLRDSRAKVLVVSAGLLPAMAAAVAAHALDGESTVRGWAAVGVSYPGFADDLASLVGTA